MNVNHNSQQVTKANSTLIQNDVLKFMPRTQTKASRKKGWICNLSQQYVFSQAHHEYLQIKTNDHFSQFTLICKLLEADTCRVIYFDDQLSANQLLELRKRQQGSQTELLHAKIAFMFSAEVATLYA